MVNSVNVFDYFRDAHLHAIKVVETICYVLALSILEGVIVHVSDKYLHPIESLHLCQHIADNQAIRLGIWNGNSELCCLMVIEHSIGSTYNLCLVQSFVKH